MIYIFYYQSCQTHGAIGSVIGLAGPVSVHWLGEMASVLCSCDLSVAALTVSVFEVRFRYCREDLTNQGTVCRFRCLPRVLGGSVGQRFGVLYTDGVSIVDRLVGLVVRRPPRERQTWVRFLLFP